nr:MAG TPA: hypothetical protein [Caudoviricetes sp.]
MGINTPSIKRGLRHVSQTIQTLLKTRKTPSPPVGSEGALPVWMRGS